MIGFDSFLQIKPLRKDNWICLGKIQKHILKIDFQYTSKKVTIYNTKQNKNIHILPSGKVLLHCYRMLLSLSIIFPILAQRSKVMEYLLFHSETMSLV